MTPLIETLVAAAIRGTVLVATIAIAVRLLRHAPASTRHAPWAAGFGALLLLPVTRLITPRWERLPHVPVTATNTPPPPAVDGASTLIDEARVATSRTTNWAALGALLWITGVLATLASFAVGRWRAARMIHRAHVRRRDGLVQLLVDACCALHWFNPLVWYASAQLVSESEVACDDRVVLAGTPALDYAEELLAVADAFRAPSPRVALAVTRPGANGVAARERWVVGRRAHIPHRRGVDQRRRRSARARADANLHRCGASVRLWQRCTRRDHVCRCESSVSRRSCRDSDHREWSANRRCARDGRRAYRSLQHRRAHAAHRAASRSRARPTMMRLTGLLALCGSIAVPHLATAQARDRHVAIEFPLRAGVCGDGANVLYADRKRYTWPSAELTGDFRKRQCEYGPAMLVVSGSVARLTVGAAVTTPRERLSGRVARDYFLRLARMLPGATAAQAVAAACIADEPPSSGQLAELAHATNVSLEARSAAIGWIPQLYRTSAPDILTLFIHNEALPWPLRERALQGVWESGESGVEMMLAFATSRAPDRLRARSLQWLGQTPGDGAEQVLRFVATRDESAELRALATHIISERSKKLHRDPHPPIRAPDRSAKDARASQREFR